jgi:protein-disulfide isomerase
MVLLTGAALLAGVVVVLVVALGQGGTGTATPTGAPVTSANPFGLATPAHTTPTNLANGMDLGSSGAPVTIELYEDYQCPICGQFVNTELWRLVDDFVRPGLVKIVTHDIAILGAGGSGDESVAAATAARCANDQGKYWPFHDWIYANQAGENKGGFAADRLAAIATAAGLDATTYQACISAGTERATVLSTTQTALTQGFNQTPTLVINGQKAVGLPDYNSLATYLRSLLPSGAPSASPSVSGAPSPSPSQ